MDRPPFAFGAVALPATILAKGGLFLHYQRPGSTPPQA